MLDECIELGRVEGGKLEIKRDRLAKGIRQMPDGPVVVKVTRKKATRSVRQNAYYHGVVVPAIAKETGQDVESIHEFLKSTCNGQHVEITDKRSGEITERHIGGSTAALNVNDFYEYVERCRAWAGSFLGLVIQDPE